MAIPRKFFSACSIPLANIPPAPSAKTVTPFRVSKLAPHVSRATGSQRETSRAAPGTQAARCQAGTPRGAPRGEQAQIGEDTHVSAYPRIRVYAVSRIRGYADTCIRGAARVRGYVIGLTQRIRCGYAPAFTSLYVWRQHQ